MALVFNGIDSNYRAVLLEAEGCEGAPFIRIAGVRCCLLRE